MTGQGPCTVIFVRYPERGAVKSRLAAHLDEGFVAALYEAFVTDLLALLHGHGQPFYLAFTPAEREADLRRLFGPHRGFPQCGADLGERMGNAFRRCFSAGFARVVLIGSDIPDLPPETLAEAHASLEGHGAVLGPSVDGGYYLIGFRREAFAPAAFEDIAWSTGEVFARTMAKLGGVPGGVQLLHRRRDVDTLEDLRDLVRRSRGTPFARSRTMACLAAGPCLGVRGGSQRGPAGA